MKALVGFGFLIITHWSFGQGAQQIKRPEINVVYGEKHIFTIETPTDWINDKESAKTIGLVNFFYAKADTAVRQKSYLYANGYDKASVTETLEEFIKSDLKIFRKKYPNCKIEIMEVGFSDSSLKNAKLYSFSNLSDRYKEEVLYSETNESIIVFSFSATTESDHKKYQLVFDDFVKSFKYRGDNPKPFLEYMNKKNR